MGIHLYGFHNWVNIIIRDEIKCRDAVGACPTLDFLVTNDFLVEIDDISLRLSQVYFNSYVCQVNSNIRGLNLLKFFCLLVFSWLEILLFFWQPFLLMDSTLFIVGIHNSINNNRWGNAKLASISLSDNYLLIVIYLLCIFVGELVHSHFIYFF